MTAPTMADRRDSPAPAQAAEALARSAVPKEDKAGYRPDIDGLRAVAIASVVLYHVGAGLAPGGFVGVDVFFVISGFLIGGILLREISQGRFSFARFYARRARRILPALIGVLLFTCAAGLLLCTSAELRELAIEALGALVGLSNIKFWLINNYFAPAADQLPLLMTWSLGVEEQFYVVFPVLLIVLFRAPPAWRAPVVAALAVVSFALSVAVTASSPWTAFYLLPTRAWELAVGTLLAMRPALTERLAGRLGGRAADTVGIAGVLMLAAAIGLFRSTMAFPGYAAALPVAGTALLVVARDGIVNRRLLASRPFVAVGLVSYSWYLWHWPLMAFVRAASERPPALGVMLAVAALSLGAGVLSWRFIERPFRYARATPGGTLKRFGAAAAATAALPALLFAAGGLPHRFGAAERRAELQQRIGPGSCQRAFGQADLPASATCMPAAGPRPAIALMGDSHANALAAGLQAAAAAENSQGAHRLLQIMKSACLPLMGVTTGDLQRPGQAAECALFLRRARERVASDPAIDTVVLAGAWPANDDPRLRALDGDRVGARLSPEQGMARGLPAMIRLMRGAGKRVAVVGDVPHFGTFNPVLHAYIEDIPVRRALNRLVQPLRYAPDIVPTGRLDRRFATVRAQVREIALREGAAYYDVADQLCTAQGCRYAQNGTPLFVDISHLSQAGSRRLRWDGLLLAPGSGSPPSGGRP